MSLSTTTNTSGRTPEQDAVIWRPHRTRPRRGGKGNPGWNCSGPFCSPGIRGPGRLALLFCRHDLMEQIHKQKSIVSPDCAALPIPLRKDCGLSSKDLNCTDNGLFEDRNRLLAELSQHAKEEWKRILAEQEDPEITRLFMDCVFMAGYAYEKELFGAVF